MTLIVLSVFAIIWRIITNCCWWVYSVTVTTLVIILLYLYIVITFVLDLLCKVGSKLHLVEFILLGTLLYLLDLSFNMGIMQIN